MIGALIGKLGGGIADAASDYGQAREQTEQWKHRRDAITEVARASWRPWLARLLGWSIAIHVAGAFGIMLMRVVGTMVSAEWSLVVHWSDWVAFGGDLYTLAATLLGLYIGGRTAERVAPSIGGPAGATLGSAARVITGRGKDDSESERLPTGDEISGWRTEAAPTASQPWAWSGRSRARLQRAHPDLQRLFNWLLPRSPYDLTITQTTRTREEQIENVSKGASQTMNSRHLERPAMAVDFAILIGNRANWEIEKYREVTDIAKRGAHELGIAITCGIDWRTLVDGPHIELDRAVYPRQPSVLDEAPDVPLA